MGLVADIIIPSARLTRMYAENMLKNVSADQFARLATSNGQPVQSNHPAFVYGHLSLYSLRITTLLGKPGPANPPKFEDLFTNGKPCLDDPQGTIYPSMDAIIKHYNAGYDAAMELATATADSEYAKPNPAEGRMKELFPTVGAVVSFVFSAHQMSHLGQISAWRRFMGLGSPA